jgi:voltage-gated sodium channel
MSDAAIGGARPVKGKAKRVAPVGQRKNLLEHITESDLFKFFIFACIVVNALMLGYDAHFGPQNGYRVQIEQWNLIFLYIFTAELALEFVASGPRRWARNGWNWFDFVIVGLSWISAAPGITALRAFRVIRVFRLVSNVPQMQRVVEALVRAMPGVFATMSILAIVFYIGAIMATTLFGQDFPQRFGDLQRSALVLFQLTLFDDWGNIVAEVGEMYPWAWAFFLGFTVLSAFAVLNLFIGVIVDAVQEARGAELKKDVKEIGEDVSEIEEGVEGLAQSQVREEATQSQILAEMRALRAEVNALRGAGPSVNQPPAA